MKMPTSGTGLWAPPHLQGTPAILLRSPPGRRCKSVDTALPAASVPPKKAVPKKQPFCSGYCICSPAIHAAACCALDTCDCRIHTINIPTMASQLPRASGLTGEVSHLQPGHCSSTCRLRS